MTSRIAFEMLLGKRGGIDRILRTDTAGLNRDHLAGQFEARFPDLTGSGAF
jgi:hypothetical protein